MAEKTFYQYSVTPQQVDFTLRATIPSLGDDILATAGVDAQRKGFGVDTLNDSNCTWVLSRFAMEIDRRPKQYESYEVATWVNGWNRMASTRNFTLQNAEGEIFARAVSLWCVLDLTTRRAVDMTSMVEACRHLMVDDPSPIEMPRKVAAVEPQRTERHRVVYSDIDFNRHMNTMRYICLMLDMLPIERLAENRPVRLDFHFLHECRYGQTLTIACQEFDEYALFEIASEEAVAVRARIEWR